MNALADNDSTEAFIKALTPLTTRMRNDVTWKKDENGKIACQHYVPLSEKRLREHLNGTTACGLCPIKEGENTTRVALFDLDSHKGETSWEEMKKQAIRLFDHLEALGYYPIAFLSSGGKGIHIILIWDTPQHAYRVRQFLCEVLAALNFKQGTDGVAAGQIEIFPKQNNVPIGGYGNMFILPLAGKSVPLWRDLTTTQYGCV